MGRFSPTTGSRNFATASLRLTVTSAPPGIRLSSQADDRRSSSEEILERGDSSPPQTRSVGERGARMSRRSILAERSNRRSQPRKPHEREHRNGLTLENLLVTFALP